MASARTENVALEFEGNSGGRESQEDQRRSVQGAPRRRETRRDVQDAGISIGDISGEIKCESGCAYHGITVIVTNLLMKVQHVAVSENSVHSSFVLVTVIWTSNLFPTLSANVFRTLQHGLRLHVPSFYSKFTVNIGSVSIADYLVAEM